MPWLRRSVAALCARYPILVVMYISIYSAVTRGLGFETYFVHTVQCFSDNIHSPAVPLHSRVNSLTTEWRPWLSMRASYITLLPDPRRNFDCSRLHIRGGFCSWPKSPGADHDHWKFWSRRTKIPAGILVPQTEFMHTKITVTCPFKLSKEGTTYMYFTHHLHPFEYQIHEYLSTSKYLSELCVLYIETSGLSSLCEQCPGVVQNGSRVMRDCVTRQGEVVRRCCVLSDCLNCSEVVIGWGRE